LCYDERIAVDPSKVGASQWETDPSTVECDNLVQAIWQGTELSPKCEWIANMNLALPERPGSCNNGQIISINGMSNTLNTDKGGCYLVTLVTHLRIRAEGTLPAKPPVFAVDVGMFGSGDPFKFPVVFTENILTPFIADPLDPEAWAYTVQHTDTRTMCISDGASLVIKTRFKNVVDLTAAGITNLILEANRISIVFLRLGDCITCDC